MVEKICPTLTKLPEGPIISPQAKNGWEAWQTFNPGVILLENRVHFLYRAIGEDAISRLGYAVSSDGFKIDERLPYTVYEHSPTDTFSYNFFSFTSGGSFGGCEDPRPVRVNNEETIYMTYTAFCDQGLRIALTSIKVEDFLNKKWRWKKPVYISPPGQVHKNWVIFPEKINGSYAILHSLNPQISIDFFDDLEFDGKTYINSVHDPEPKGSHWNWESRIRGTGTPPIKTQDGWLIIYHGEDRRDPGKYKVGAMLLDLEEPTRVLHCTKKPILEADKLYENIGFKPGVVYATGAVVKDDTLLIYYGGADSSVCVAYSDLEKFLTTLKEDIKPELKAQPLKKKEDKNDN
ncbi:MAG: hypothetical protein PQ975_04175 [Methanobacterium sp.]|jgi:predicted GH43/DUF377 family glycosyl hydrolase